MVQTKRGGGMLDESGKWYILTKESTETQIGWRHECGAEILMAEVILMHRDGVSLLSGDGSTRNLSTPYCPNCERKPLSGTFGPTVRTERGFLIDRWEH